jgi:hypothetical protein
VGPNPGRREPKCYGTRAESWYTEGWERGIVSGRTSRETLNDVGQTNVALYQGRTVFNPYSSSPLVSMPYFRTAYAWPPSTYDRPPLPAVGQKGWNEATAR